MLYEVITASWVETPAFTGAVLRNVLEPTQVMLDRAAKVLNSPPPEWDANQMQRAATMGRSATDISILEDRFHQDARVVGRVTSGPLTDSDVLAVGRDVITSYSIHYTKLYEEGRAFARDVLKMLALNDMTVTQGFLNAFHKGKETDEKGKGKTKPTSKPTTDPESLAERVRQAKTDDKALKGAADELAHCIAKAVTQEDLESCLKAGEGVQVQDLRLTMSTAEKLSGTVPDKMNPNVARVRHVSETGDLSVLDQKVEPKDDGSYNFV